MLTHARSSTTTFTFRWASTAFRKTSVSARTIRPCTQRTATLPKFVVCTLSMISSPYYPLGATKLPPLVTDEGRSAFDSSRTFSRFLWLPLWLALAARISSSRLIPNALQGEFYVELLRHNRSLFGCEESNYLRLRSYFQLYKRTQDRCLLITEFLQTIGVRHSGERKFAQLLISHFQ